MLLLHFVGITKRSAWLASSQSAATGFHGFPVLLYASPCALVLLHLVPHHSVIPSSSHPNVANAGLSQANLHRVPPIALPPHSSVPWSRYQTHSVSTDIPVLSLVVLLRSQAQTLQRGVGRVLVDNVLDADVLWARRSECCERVAHR
jgi:hypothetical protein